MWKFPTLGRPNIGPKGLSALIERTPTTRTPNSWKQQGWFQAPCVLLSPGVQHNMTESRILSAAALGR